MLPETIHTERLTLRALAAADAPAMVAGLSDWEVTGWLDSPPYPYELDHAQAFIAGASGKDRPGRVWGIDDGDGLVGVIGIGRREAAMQLGFWLARNQWGLGYMTEAATAAVRAFFASRPDIMLVSGAFEGNAASLRIQERLGFVRVAETMRFSRTHGRRVPHVATMLGRESWLTQEDLRERVARSCPGAQAEGAHRSPDIDAAACD